ncbi:TPA: D-tyrosyl-tRNA(Tyr) deacylase, partial [Legionella pneumophila]|nr:D-tyrosyl-tRNA(Tyr) deacylase [Legionella pneumophila]HBI2924070.1 D-aminoacyl-tRNA deacylase [Legionella pneumophila]
MLTVLQRVKEARVDIDGQTVGKINHGLLILCGFEPKDSLENIKRMLDKCINYRIFE